MDCSTKKVQYTSERFAMMDIARIKKISSRDKVPVRAYFCDICNLWHLTSSGDRKEEAKNKRILTLEGDIKKLKIEIEELKKTSNKKDTVKNKEDRIALKSDARIKEAMVRVNSQNGIIKKLRKDSEELICKNIQLQNKLEKYETGKSNDNGS